ncbi:MAG: hypothetical protein K0S41_3670 [Anaerocolumna sp.]|jgi:hypothetical protein|nr:hypothetical protein [Anaerocolumna sp.]
MITKNFDLEDVFKVSEIIDKMGLEADISKITKSIQTSKVEHKKDVNALGKEIAVGIGLDVITKIIRNLHKAKKEVKELMSNMTGLSMEEVSKLGIKDIKEFFVELFSYEGFEDFLSQAGESNVTK